MVRIILTIILILGSYIGFSQSSEKEETFSVTVTVNDIRNTDGTFYVSLYDSEETFKTRIPVKGKFLKLENDSIATTFENIPKGEYVVGCFHDQNDNKKMAFYETGIPMENYGLSNMFQYYGPPTFDQAKFEVSDTNLTFEIKLF